MNARLLSLAVVTVGLVNAAAPPEAKRVTAGSEVAGNSVRLASEASETTVFKLPGETPRPAVQHSPAPATVKPPARTSVQTPAAAPSAQPESLLPASQAPAKVPGPESLASVRSMPDRGLAPVVPPAAPHPAVPEEFTKDSALFLQRRLGTWKDSDARKLLGEPARKRAALDDDGKPDGTILAFADPSKKYREFELDFDRKSGNLRTVFVYPWKMKWEDCRNLWGANVTVADAAAGRKFYSYQNRHLDVLVDRSGTVVSLGLY